MKTENEPTSKTRQVSPGPLQADSSLFSPSSNWKVMLQGDHTNARLKERLSTAGRSSFLFPANFSLVLSLPVFLSLFDEVAILRYDIWGGM